MDEVRYYCIVQTGNVSFMTRSYTDKDVCINNGLAEIRRLSTIKNTVPILTLVKYIGSIYSITEIISSEIKIY